MVAYLVVTFVYMFRQSSPLCDFRVDDEGIAQIFMHTSYGFLSSPRLYRWDEIASHSLLNQGCGQVLTLEFNDGRDKVLFTHSAYFRDQTSFQAFVAALTLRITTGYFPDASPGSDAV